MRSCLLIKNDGIGDLVLAAPIINSLFQYFDGEFDLVTCIENKPIVDGFLHVRETYYVSRDSIKFETKGGRIDYSNFNLLPDDKDVCEKINSVKYHSAIVLRRFIRQSTFIIMKYINAEHKICFWQYPTNISFDEAVRYTDGWKRVTQSKYILHETAYYASALSKVLANFNFNLEQKQKETELTNKQVIINISGTSSRWPFIYWLIVIKKIEAQGYSILLTGSKNDIYLSRIIKKYCITIDNLVGVLSLEALISKIIHANIYIGNDTGISHIASQYARVCIVLMGGGTFNRFFPNPNSKNHYTLFHSMDCYDCGWKCKYYFKPCLLLLRPSIVFNKITQILKDNNLPVQCDLNKNSYKKYRLAWNFEKGQVVREIFINNVN